MPPLPLVRQLVTERKSRGMSVDEVADLAGYSLDHFKKSECGNRHPGLHALTAWADTLGFDLVLQNRIKPSAG